MASQRTITIKATVTGGGDPPAWIHVSLLDSGGTATPVSEQQVKLDAGTSHYTLTASLDDGTYALRVDAVAGGFEVPTAATKVELGGGATIAEVSVEFTTAEEREKVQAWLSPALAAAVAAATGFWVVVLALPAKSDNGIPGLTLLAFLVLAAVVLAVGVVLFLFAIARTWGIVLMIAGGLVAAAALALNSKIDLDDGRRMGIGVGGLAVAALIVGIQRFDTIRATVALPVVVVFIGIATWPNAEALIGEDVRTEVIRWVAALLGATALAEGVTQAASAVAEGRAKAAALQKSDSTPAEIAAAGRLVPEPSGDLGRGGSR